MVTTRSGASTSDTAVGCSKHPPEEPSQSPPRLKRPRVSKARQARSGIPNQVGLVKMPIDVFVEIVRHVLPADLIHLSRTCKYFRGFLMRRSAEHIWRCAESNFPELPPYPWLDMCPPRYAALLFTKDCSRCGERTSTDVDPYLLVRFCPTCRETELIEIDRCAPETRRIYDLICKTKLIRLKKKDSKKCQQDRGKLSCCLRTELERTRHTYYSLDKVDKKGRYLWEDELSGELALRRDFAKKLQEFLEHVVLARGYELRTAIHERALDIYARLNDLGWSEWDYTFSWPYSSEWQALVSKSQKLTDRVWDNLYPKLVPLLEANRLRAQENEVRDRRFRRKVNVFGSYHTLVHQHSPMTPIIHALGFEADNTSEIHELPHCLSNLLWSYPFPDAPTMLSWPWVNGVRDTDMSLEERQRFWADNWDSTALKVAEWREKIELELFERLVNGRSGADEDVSIPISDRLEINNITEPTSHLSAHARALLRADSVFSLVPPGSPDGQGYLRYYPTLESTGTRLFMDILQGDTKKIESERYHCHLEGRLLSRALLEALGMPDVTYLELALMEDCFVCRRCYSTEAMSWDEILEHYSDALKSWKITSSHSPRFKTRHPVPYLNAHDPRSSQPEHPLVQIITPAESEALKAPQLNPDGFLACLPCRNYSQVFVADRMEAMVVHQREVHDVHSVVKDTHYELANSNRHFLAYGKEWAESWDLSRDTA